MSRIIKNFVLSLENLLSDPSEYATEERNRLFRTVGVPI